MKSKFVELGLGFFGLGIEQWGSLLEEPALREEGKGRQEDGGGGQLLV